jgi:hypothetical protein
VGGCSTHSVLVFGFGLGENKRGDICVMTSSWMVRTEYGTRTGLFELRNNNNFKLSVIRKNYDMEIALRKIRVLIPMLNVQK